VALLEYEAQLAYILAHESAHVHRNHWFHRIQLGAVQPYYDAEKQQNESRRPTNVLKQITKLYVRLADVARLDERSTLGFMGNVQRVSEPDRRVSACARLRRA
jgi:hypothetical protein